MSPDREAGARGLWVRSAALLPLLLLLAAACLVRVPGLPRPFWIDEIITIRTASQDVPDIMAQRSTPLVFLLAKGSLAFSTTTGMPSELALRAPHLLAGLAAMVLLYMLLLRRQGVVAATVAAAVLAFSPAHAAHCVEARYYAPLMLLVPLLVAAAERALESGRRRDWAALFAVSAVGAFLHLLFLYCLALVLAGMLFYGAFTGPVRTLHNRALPPLLCGAAVAALFLAVLLLGSSGDGARRVLYLLHLASPPESVQAVDGLPVPLEMQGLKFTLTPERYRLYVRSLMPEPQGGWLALLAGLALAGMAAAWRGRRRMLAAVLPLLALFPLPFFLFHTSHWWTARYFTPQIPVLALMAGLGAGWLFSLLARMLSVRARPCLSALPFGPLARGFSVRVRLCLSVFSFGPLACRLSAAGGVAACALSLALAGAALARGDALFDRDIYRDMPHVGMREAARGVARGAAPGDTVVFAPHPAQRWYPADIFEYYFKTGGGPEGVRTVHCDDPDCVAGELDENVENTVWVVTPNTEKLRWLARVVRAKSDIQGINALLTLACGTPASFEDSLLWTRPAGHEWRDRLARLDALRLFPAGDAPGAAARLRLEPGTELEGDGVGMEPSVRVFVPGDAPEQGRPTPTFWLNLAEEALPRLECAEVFLLSFEVKCLDVAAGANPARTGRVMVAAAGFWRDVYFISGTCDWREERLVLTRGEELPGELKGLRFGFGNRGGTGTFWIRNVRLYPLRDDGGAARTGAETVFNE